MSIKAHDPQAFLPSVGEFDLHLFSRGVHYEAYHILGARRVQHQGAWGVRFLVWAPDATGCSVVGDFNHWNGKTHPMRSLGHSGVWEVFIPKLDLGEKYKFLIKDRKGIERFKTDPYALQMEHRPGTASIVAEVSRFAWSDAEFIRKRSEKQSLKSPINIYELHAGSWRRPYGHTFNYRELAVELAPYCIEMGYTHVELMPIQEHPLDESWGYQVSGFFAVTSRYGTPEDFQWMVNHLHEKGIGVILDWVPGHFPVDEFSLSRFDGTALYEHEDPRKGFHPHWQTNIFNFGRNEVSNFLIASALFWIEKMHIDGLRVDAVASMLYLDYGRPAGEWIPNVYGGNENLEAIEFFKHLNQIVHERNPGVLMIAEDSSSFAGVTKPVFDGGLGFDFKWNMGWMNDTLRYFTKDPFFRSYQQKDLTFGLLYAFKERYLLPLSHDEVVHGKGSLISKTPGDRWQKFAHLRLMVSYQIAQPGKKLIFMGAEIGQWKEWACGGELDWGLLQYDEHRQVQTMVREINHFYLQHRALWENDGDPSTFAWIDFSDLKNNVIAYLRKGGGEQLLCVHNFSPNYENNYQLKLPHIKEVFELFNSDAEVYGGSGKTNPHVAINGSKISFQLAPLSTMIFQVHYS